MMLCVLLLLLLFGEQAGYGKPYEMVVAIQLGNIESEIQSDVQKK